MAPQRSRVIALWIWYRGDRFRGFQAQVEGPTVQQELARALSTLGVEGQPNPAGRTDLGVHARMQVVSVRIPQSFTPESLVAELRPRLPQGLGVCMAKEPNGRFHAQWSATGKEYRYRFSVGAPPPGWDGGCWDVTTHERLSGKPVDVDVVAELLRHAEGTHDFIAFHGKSSVRKPRTIDTAQLRARGSNLYEVTLEGSGFARHQVRYLVGSAVLAASGELPKDRYRDAIENGTEIPGLRAPAEGLVLWEVRYPPDVDPFTPEERADAPNLPMVPPFTEG